MARPASKDPLDKFRWAVEIDGFTRMGFASCDVPSLQIQTKAYPEGGQHLAPKQIVDSVAYKPVTLTRGVTSNVDFDGWARQFIELVRGSIDKVGILGAFNNNNNKSTDYRRDVKIHHLNRKGQKVKTYTLYKAFPTEYVPASEFSSDGDDMLSMEKLVLTYESFDVVSTSTDSNPFDVRDVAKRLTGRLF